MQRPDFRPPQGPPRQAAQPGWGMGWAPPQTPSERGVASPSWPPPQYPRHGAPGPWQPPPPPRRRGGWVVGVLVTLGALALLGFAVLTLLGMLRPDVDDDPSVEPSPPVVSVPPGEEPDPVPPGTEIPEEPDAGTRPPGWELPERAWPDIPPANSSDPNWRVVQTSELYTARFPIHAGCPAPRYAFEYEEMQDYITQQMGCIQRAWKDVQNELGFSDHDIPVHFFSGDGVSSACGYVEAPAFYCSADGGAIYFGQGTLDWGTFQLFGMKDMAAHEYGHHLQAQAGFFEAMYYLGNDDEIIRRSELQATCFGQGMIGRDDSFVMDEEYYDELALKHEQVVDDGTHGSNKANDFWGFRGLYADSLSECNTWTSPSKDVK